LQRQRGKGYIVSIFFREPKSDRFCGEIEKKRIQPQVFFACDWGIRGSLIAYHFGAEIMTNNQ